ncbi:1-deoxy-D-xylulose-5-phosphate reductoisomerase [Candidatus Daviesbacteria bacterium]|nr:1-deoxy-D-xylulose-5-phosphate reductoisomerase [Candidatus Daviesbacteria bacterium]
MITQVSVLGSTGSIGTQTLDVLKEHKKHLSPLGLSAGNNIELLRKQVLHFKPTLISVRNEESAKNLRFLIGKRNPEILWGDEGNIAVATLTKTDRVLVSTPGFPGIRPTIEAIKKGKTIALATKEVLVAAGQVVTQSAKQKGVRILPVDSEHSAIFQCLEGRSPQEVRRIILTCSGGPFRGMRPNQLKKVTLKHALNHPNWKMGRKITIDSATLMNKGFEVIEAFWLFGIPLEKIKVIVHPQSIIHSAVEFVDGTIIAQLGPADMRLPIQYALFYPEKRQSNHFKRFSFEHYPNLTFEHADQKTFRCLALAYETLKKGGTYPAVLSAANDIAVESFLEQRLPFYKIPVVIEKTLEKHKKVKNPKLEDIFAADSWARTFAQTLI